MRLDYINKEERSGRVKLEEEPKTRHNKGKEKLTCYACGNQGHMTRDCRNKNEVTRQLNVFENDSGLNDGKSWNVTTQSMVKYDPSNKGTINKLKDQILTPSKSSDEAYKTSKELQPSTYRKKREKATRCKDECRSDTLQTNLKLMKRRINILLTYIGEPEVECHYEGQESNAKVQMERDLWNVTSQIIYQSKKDIPPTVLQCMPAKQEMDDLERSIRLCEQTQKPRRATRVQRDWKRDNSTQFIWYSYDARNMEHGKLSWTACIADCCLAHYSEKVGAGWYPRKIRGFPKCNCHWYECKDDECPKHLWDKREKKHFPGHSHSREITRMHTMRRVEYAEEYAYKCRQPNWQTCLSEECDLHRNAKSYYGFIKKAFQVTAKTVMPLQGNQHSQSPGIDTVSMRSMHRSTPTCTYKIEAVEPHTIAIIAGCLGGVLC